MKRIFIVHGWGGSPQEPIHSWLKKSLEQSYVVSVISPLMPKTDNPIINKWVHHLSEQVGKCDENTFFFGHSIGCQTIMRYLEGLPRGQRAGGAVFLSGWFNLDNMESDEEERIARPWIKDPINFNKVKYACSKFEVIISDDEPYGYVKENAEIFKKELGAKVTIEHGKGHYTEGEGITEIPSVLDKLVKMAHLTSK